MTARRPQVRSILVVATRQIGDVLLTTPMIRQARALWPDAAIDVLGFPGTLGMLEGNPDVRRLIKTPAGSGGRSAWRLATELGLWRAYDLALVTQHNDRAHFYGFVAAPLRAGLIGPKAGTTWWKHLLLKHAVVIAGDAGRLHAAEDNLRLLEPWRDAPAATGGVASTSAAEPITVVPPPAAPLPPDVEALLEPAPVVVHVPVMWRYKAWPVESFRELIATLVGDAHQVVLTGGPSANDKLAVAEMAQVAPAPRIVDVCGRLDFAQLATLLRRSALYIGTDTSVTHLAAACSVPTIALFGPTNPIRWGPLDPALPIERRFEMRSKEPQRRGRVILMQGPGACVPCAGRGCEGHDESRSACLDGLPPAQVIAEARAVLRPVPSASPTRRSD